MRGACGQVGVAHVCLCGSPSVRSHASLPSVLPTPLSSCLWVSLSASYLIPLHPSPASWALPGPPAVWAWGGGRGQGCSLDPTWPPEPSLCSGGASLSGPRAGQPGPLAAGWMARQGGPGSCAFS